MVIISAPTGDETLILRLFFVPLFSNMFIIEDEIHADWHVGQFETFAAALEALRHLSQVPWDEPPNAAPCTNWRNCGRSYSIVHFDTSVTPWNEIERIDVVRISAQGIEWSYTEPI